MNEVKWKSDKKCYECRIKQRKEIIKEIKEQSGCKTCNKFNKIKDTDLEKRNR